MTDEIEKLKMHSPDLTQDNIAKIAALFPGCVTEAAGEDGVSTLKVDFDQLRQELSDSIVEGPQERYHLDWPGKRQALITANAPIAKTLRPVREESVDFDNTQNLFIEGDNLEALKLLQETYLGKVKMIYIDPPYNTGNDFVYDDDFSENTADFLERSNQKDEAGNRLVANTASNGRFHSDWLSMMYSRLKLARNLLSEDGAIFVSIDGIEHASLMKICNEIFGETNRIASIVWEKSRKNDARFFSVGHDYMICFVKNKQHLIESNVYWREEKPGAAEIHAEFLRLRNIHGDDFVAMEEGLKAFYSNLDKEHPARKHRRYNKVDENGVWRDDNMSWPGGDGPRYELPHPVTGKPCEIPPGGWRYATIAKMNAKIDDGTVVFREDHTEPPIKKTYLVRPTAGDAKTDDSIGKQVIGSYFYKSALSASTMMNDLMGDAVFNNPKDHHVLRRFIEYTTGPEDIILDFFAGSGSTAHAVLDLNLTMETSRKFIAVQLPEATPEKSIANRLGYENIADISKERIRRAGEALKQERPSSRNKVDVGFRVLKIDSSNMADVFYTPDATTQADLLARVDNIKPDRSPEDLLFQVLLDWGVDLTLPITREVLHGKTVFFVAGTALAACFDDGVDEVLVKDLAARTPLRVVFKDTGFKDDATKINVKQIFKSLSPDTDVKAI
jgi:adenine-specific DNA-methyltransferase